MKRILVFLLAAVIIFSFYGCKEKTNNNNTDTTKSQITADRIDETDYNPNLSVIDAGGRTIKFLTRVSNQSANYWYEEIFDEGISANIVSDSVYSRNSIIKDKYNIKIEEITSNNIQQDVIIQANSGTALDASFDIAVPMIVNAFNLANRGCLYSIDELENISPNNPYWFYDIYQATTINETNFFISGDINTSVYGSSWTTFFNEKIVEQNGIQSPYEIVKSGKWTTEKMLEMSAGYGGDKNGDGVFDNNDEYAICSGTWVWQCFFYGADLKFIDKDNEDIPYIVSMNNEKTAKMNDVLTGLVNVMNNPTLSVNSNKAGLSGQPSKLFCDSQVLFYFANVNNAFIPDDIKDMSDDYGMLPLPKFDDQQKYYCNSIHPHHSSTIAVPINLPGDDLYLLSSIIEDMAYYSYKLVKPAYYENVITFRSVRNEQSYEMMQYIYNNFNIDLGLIMTDTFGFDASIRTAILNNDTNFASYFKSFNSMWNISLEQITSQYGVLNN